MRLGISLHTLRRLPMYLSLLQSRAQGPDTHISARALAEELGLVEVQVRKDLASVSSGGRPRLGYAISELSRDIEQALGYNNANNGVLVGAGKLGRALLSYQGFADYGLNIVAAFDLDPRAQGVDSSGKHVLPMDKLQELCQRMQIRIGIITTPADCAQVVCDQLVQSGIRAIWNFAPTHLKAPEDILIKTENMVVSLAQLSAHLSKPETEHQEVDPHANSQQTRND